MQGQDSEAAEWTLRYLRNDGDRMTGTVIRKMAVPVSPFGKTLSEAIQASRAAHPDRLAFAMRVGHDAAVHIGVMTS